MGAMASQLTGVSIICPAVCFRRRSKKTSKLRVTGICEGNPPVTGGFPSHRASDVGNVFSWWRHHERTRDLTTTIHSTTKLCACFMELKSVSNLLQKCFSLFWQIFILHFPRTCFTMLTSNNQCIISVTFTTDDLGILMLLVFCIQVHRSAWNMGTGWPLPAQ